MNAATTVLFAGLAAAGTLFTLQRLGLEVTAMEGQHWIMLMIVLVVGYVLGRMWATPAQLVGLP